MVDTNGAVQQTLVFNDIEENANIFEIPLLNPMSADMLKTKLTDDNFGRLIQLTERFVVAYNSTILYILDVDANQTVAKISHLRK